MTFSIEPGLGGAMSLASIAYLVLALRQLARFRGIPDRTASRRPGVTIMLPVYGAPPRLYECLRSCCNQDYPEFQVVFGLHRADDPGVHVIERLMRELSHVPMTLVVDERRIGSNPKVCNLANMYRAARHDVIVMIDSDVVVGRDFLEVVAGPLSDPAVGAVTCLYKGLPEPNLASHLGALHINEWIAPSALVDLGRRTMDVCFGAVMAVRRESLAAIGGLEALAFAVAEDDVLGQLLNEAGYRIVLSPYVVGTVVAEPDLPSLFRHELRWMRSVRACRPLDHALAVVVHGLVPSALFLLACPTELTALLVAVLMALRFGLHLLVRSRFGFASPPSFAMVLCRESLTFFVWAASFLSWSMTWGGETLHAGDGRTMTRGMAQAPVPERVEHPAFEIDGGRAAGSEVRLEDSSPDAAPQGWHVAGRPFPHASMPGCEFREPRRVSDLQRFYPEA